MDRLYLRHSTDKQTDARQRHALSALLASGAPAERKAHRVYATRIKTAEQPPGN
ncbi:hypothetical protein [Actinomadura harenae]|uniref:hypothetical protein n=1 Tax=Actinomadura harenae TaxID=2483351 RepID=UPI0018F7540A|nr:hypothetical protein [Actinomadura harenae]